MTDVSVIVPARDAAAGLPRTLAALRAQDFDGDYEVIVVDDGSVDATGAIAHAAGARVVRHDTPRGPADSRNSGVAQAQAPLLAFTDSDCVPDSGWLRAGAAAASAADLVQGRVEPEPGDPPGAFDHTIVVRSESLLYETANLFVRREWFDRVGGFAALIPPSEGHFGEDVVFGWTARRLGARPAFAHDALVHHEVVRRPAAAWIRERRRLRLFPMLTQVVPELRGRMPARTFLSARTARFDAALAGVLAAAVSRRVWPLLAAGPYLRHSFRTWDPWSRTGLAENAALLAGDCVAFASLLEGSVRARTLVL